MGRLARIIATAAGLGYVPKAPGTAGSLIGLLLGVMCPSSAAPILVWGGLAASFLVGVVASARTEQGLGIHDPSCVVIDEVVAMWLVFAILTSFSPPVSWAQSLVPFAVFRGFDILKPPPLKWLARAPGGWGIMLDDLGAAAYTCLSLLALKAALLLVLVTARAN